MTLEEMKEYEWTVSWSGGKDSTATIILMHENNIPIKRIIYVRMMYDETLPATLPVMTEFVDQSKKIFESWGYLVDIIYSKRTAKELIERIYRKSHFEERNGKVYGVTSFTRGICNFTGEKQKTIAKSLSSNDEYQMIGYACDEMNRLQRLNDKKQSIMVTLGVKECDTFEICKKYNLLSPLYNLGFSRDGCWFCPNADKKEREYLRNNNPELVEKINEMIEMCDYDLSSISSYRRNNWVTDYFKDKFN